jgi:two-component system, NarL family, nitrate/nitrite response regulator NarL
MSELCPTCGRGFLRWNDPSELTQREAETVQLLLEGLSNREIGFRMGDSEQVIKTRLWRVYRKLGVHSRLELALIAEQPLAREAC